MELVPYFPVEVASAFESFDSAKFQCWVKRSEIAEFHRNGAWGAPDPFGQIDDHGLPLVELPEAEFVVEIEDDEELIPGPEVYGGHVGFMPMMDEGASTN